MKKNILSLLVVVGLIGSVSASVLSGDLTNDLVAWYPFNGDANDYSGNGRDLTLRQPEYASYTSGYNNQLALNLGGNNRADYFTSNTTDVTSNWSFSCWINPPSISYNFPEWSCLFDTTNLYGTEMGLSYGNNINTQTTYYNQGVVK